MTVKAIREKVDRAFELTGEIKELSGELDGLKAYLKEYGEDHKLEEVKGDVAKVIFKDGKVTSVDEDRLFDLLVDGVKKKLTKAEVADLKDFLFSIMSPAITKIRKAAADYEFNLYHYIKEETKPYHAASFKALTSREAANKPLKAVKGRKRRKRR